MMPLTVQTICAAVGGTVLQSSGAAVRDVTTDSRRVPQEALFIPLVGNASTAMPISKRHWRPGRRDA